jgi:hypothetical protein
VGPSRRTIGRKRWQTARAEATVPTADYLLGSPHFADHLEAGAEAMGFDITDEEDDLM